MTDQPTRQAAPDKGAASPRAVPTRWQVVACPKCGAAVDDPCRSLTSGGPTMIHKARWAAARAVASAGGVR